MSDVKAPTDIEDGFRILLNQLVGEMAVVNKILPELLGSFAMVHTDPSGFVTRMLDRADTMLDDELPGPGAAAANQAGHQFVSRMREGLSDLIDGKYDR